MTEIDPKAFEEDDQTPEPEPKKEPLASTTDVVVVLVLLIGGLLFWWWYRGEGDKSHQLIRSADSLYTAKRYPEALRQYRLLRDSLKISTKSEDSLLYRRIDTLGDMEEHSRTLCRGAQLAITSGDTALIRTVYRKLSADSTGFIPDTLLRSLARHGGGS